MTFQEYIELIKHQKSPFDKARLMHELIEQEGVTISSLAHHLQLSPSQISTLLSFRTIPESIRDAYFSQLITATHVRLFARLKNQDDMMALYEECLARNLSSTALEMRVREVLHGVTPDDDSAPDTMYARILQAKVHMRDPDVQVRVVQTKIRTKVTFELKAGRKKGNAFLKDLSDLV